MGKEPKTMKMLPEYQDFHNDLTALIGKHIKLPRTIVARLMANTLGVVLAALGEKVTLEDGVDVILDGLEEGYHHGRKMMYSEGKS